MVEMSMLKHRRLGWFGYIKRREDVNLVRMVEEMEVEGCRPPKKT